jgi:hypothetical protein
LRWRRRDARSYLESREGRFMQFREPGRTGVNVSAVRLGAMRFGDQTPEADAELGGSAVRLEMDKRVNATLAHPDPSL